ncbi:hypothetical protein [Salinarimonas soli]|uniref:Uncharacterized protein n=1 Tax=Salinarimonas soli TaxID=1638099 RepID=A0A5B2VHQ1_9HYPH|nr:hypothetical protein [Salinarimonas soli]KAA2237717.1 hypothetical protein F0L46_08545 [Salinarimonas soli]
MNVAVAVATIGHNNPPPLGHAEILAERHADVRRDVEAVAARATAAPRAIKTEADLDAIGTLVKDIGALVRRIDTRRTTEKAPHLQAGREVDAFFGVFTDRLEKIRETFQAIADDHARKKAAEERAAREAEARRAEAEAERQREIARRAEEANRLKTAEKHDARAEVAADQAAQATAAAQAGAADLIRTRTASGTLATGRTEWTFEITDFAAIPLEVLRAYLPRAEIEKAIRAHVRVNKGAMPIPGVRIFEDVRASFR